MGQESSQPLVPCASTRFPVSATSETLRTSSPVRVETDTNEKTRTTDRSSGSDDTTMDPNKDDSSAAGPHTTSSETDLLAEERHDSANDIDIDIEKDDDEIQIDNDIDIDNDHDYPILADVDTSDSTHQLSDTFEQEQSFYKRALRPAREAKRTAPNTWIDADVSGDFDPYEESHQARLRRKRTKHKHPQRKKIDSGEEEEDNSEPGAGLGFVLQPSRPLVCLTFISSSAKAAFAELCSKFHDKVRLARDDFTEGYQLRKRDGAGHGGVVDEAFANVTGTRVLASDWLSDHSNQPYARGCLYCPSMGVRCSLLDNEHSWPCEECEEGEFDCELVREPELKFACTHCQYLGKKLKWLVCSFDCDHDPANHRGRCEQCQKDGHQACVAGPRPGQTRTRIRIGSDGAPYMNEPVVSQKIPKVRTCRQCLDSRRVCSFASSPQQDAGDVCTACDMSGKTCEPLGREAPRPRDASHTPVVDPFNDTYKGLDPDKGPIAIISSPLCYNPDQWEQLLATSGSSLHTPFSSIEPLPDPPADRTVDTGGTIKIVRTKFCHPIHFDHQDETPDGSDPCHFCSCKHFGIVGLEERTTEVIEWYDGRGWEEIDGGHKGDNVRGTQMCTRCTVARMQIVVCPDHALRRIGEAGTMADLNAAFERLFLPDPAVEDRWCTVCCNLAVWECCVAQEMRTGEGCGLALCQACIADLERCGGSFEAMLQALDPEQSEARPAGLRADHEFLKEDGLLVRYLNWSARS